MKLTINVSRQAQYMQNLRDKLDGILNPKSLEAESLVK
jgi:hypothetical protein